MSEYIITDKQLGLIQDFANVCVEGEKLPRIVRCRDCKHYDRMNSDEGMCMVPDGDGDYARWIVDDDGYCYLGERRG